MSEPQSPRLQALYERWKAEPTSRVFLQLAEEHRRLGAPREAIAVLEQGLAGQPNYLAAYVALGRCRLDLGEAAAAAEVLEGVIARDPTQMVAYKLLVEAYVQQGQAEEARKRLRIYSLLNDSDPDIAELRRRIGEIGRHHRSPDDTLAGHWREPLREEHTSPGAVMPPPPAAPSPFLEEVEVPPVFDEAPPAPAASRPERLAAQAAAEVAQEDPFPELAAPAQAERYWSGLSGGLFDFAPPAPAAEPWPEEPPITVDDEAPPEPLAVDEPASEFFPEATAPADDDLFGLAAPPPPAELDWTGLMARPAVVAPGPEPLAELPLVLEPEPAAEPVRAVPQAAEDDLGPTATLGSLYLRQGHLEEAEVIFQQVLARAPESEAARTGLAEIAAARATPATADEVFENLPVAAAPVLAPGEELTAAVLMAGYDPARDGEGVTARRRHLLRAYLGRITQGRAADVH